MLYIPLGLSLLQDVSDDSNQISLGLGNFSSGQTQLPEWLRLIVLYKKLTFINRFQNGYLERFHHKLRIHKENSTDTEFPLLQLLHQLFHHWQVCVEFNLTWGHTQDINRQECEANRNSPQLYIDMGIALK